MSPIAVELATAYISLVPSAKGITAGIQKEMGGPLVAAGAVAGAKTSASFGTAFKSGMKGLALGAAVFGGVAALGSAFDEAFDTIEAGTGASGKTLAGLDKSFETVLKSGANSMDSVAAAVTTLFQRTGLTGKALEDFADKQATLARITKTDVATNLESTTGLFNLYGIAVADQSDKLDVLFKASQVAGVSISELAANVQAAAPTAKILGLSFEQVAGLVAGLNKAGLPASKVMLGLASSFAKAAKAGKAPLDVIHDLVEEVKAAPNATDAATIAVQKFGIGARQAATLVAGIRSGAIDLTKGLDNGKGILATAAATDDFSEKLTHLKNVAFVGLRPLATQAFDAITRSVELLTPIVATLSANMDVLGPIVLSVLAAFVAFKVTKGVVGLFGAVAKSARDARKAIADVRDGLISLRGHLSSTGSKIGGFFKAGGGGDALRLRFAYAREALVKLGSSLKSGLVSLVQWGRAALVAAANTVRQTAAFVAQKVAAVASAVATGLLTAATWLLNAAMAANPVVAVVVALIALGAAVFLAYKHFTPFRNAVDAAWQILQSMFRWVQDNWPLLVGILTGPIGIAVFAIVKNFDSIKGFVTNVFEFVRNKWPLLLGILTAPIRLAVGFISQYFETIKNIAKGAFDAVVGFVTSLPGRILQFVGAVGAAALAVGKAILDGVVKGVSGAVGAVADIGKAIANAVGGFINNQIIGNIRKGIRLLANTLADINIPGAGRAFDSASSLLNAAARNLPNIPTLAQGGVASSPILAVIGDASTPEIVSPVKLMAETFRRELHDVIGRESFTRTAADSATVSRVAVSVTDDTLRTAVAYLDSRSVEAFTRSVESVARISEAATVTRSVESLSRTASAVESFTRNATSNWSVTGQTVEAFTRTVMSSAVEAVETHQTVTADVPDVVSVRVVFEAAFQPVLDWLERAWKALRLPALQGNVTPFARGGVVRKPLLALIGENARTTPEVVSPVKLMAETFRVELARVRPTVQTITVTQDRAQVVAPVRLHASALETELRQVSSFVRESASKDVADSLARTAVTTERTNVSKESSESRSLALLRSLTTTISQTIATFATDKTATSARDVTETTARSLTENAAVAVASRREQVESLTRTSEETGRSELTTTAAETLTRHIAAFETAIPPTVTADAVPVFRRVVAVFQPVLDWLLTVVPRRAPVPALAHGAVVSRPLLALIGENSRTTPEIVSPVKLMAETFRVELARSSRPVVQTITIEPALPTPLAVQRSRRAEIVSPVRRLVETLASEVRTTAETTDSRSVVSEETSRSFDLLRSLTSNITQSIGSFVTSHTDRATSEVTQRADSTATEGFSKTVAASLTDTAIVQRSESSATLRKRAVEDTARSVHELTTSISDTLTTQVTAFGAEVPPKIAADAMPVFQRVAEKLRPVLDWISGPRRRARVAPLAHGAVVTHPILALVGENARTTPEIVSPVRLMAETFRSEIVNARKDDLFTKTAVESTVARLESTARMFADRSTREIAAVESLARTDNTVWSVDGRTVEQFSKTVASLTETVRSTSIAKTVTDTVRVESFNVAEDVVRSFESVTRNATDCARSVANTEAYTKTSTENAARAFTEDTHRSTVDRVRSALDSVATFTRNVVASANRLTSDEVVNATSTVADETVRSVEQFTRNVTENAAAHLSSVESLTRTVADTAREVVSVVRTATENTAWSVNRQSVETFTKSAVSALTDTAAVHTVESFTRSAVAAFTHVESLTRQAESTERLSRSVDEFTRHTTAETPRFAYRVPALAQGAVATQPMLALIGETAQSTPEIVSPVALMAATFRAELDATNTGQTIDASINVNGHVYGVDDLNALADERDRKLLALLRAG